MQVKHTHFIAGLALAGSLTLASCGSTSSASSKQVASLGGTTTTLAGAAGAAGDGGGFAPDPARAAAFKDALLANAKCMRDNGVPTDDPTFDANGRPSGGRGRGGDTPPAGVTQATFDAANKTCDPILQKVRDAFKPDPAQQAARRKQLLDFAACMREKGADFPDPTFDANGRPQFGTGGGVRDKINNDPTLKADADACQAAGRGFRPAGAGNGGPPNGGPPPGASGGTPSTTANKP